RRHEWRLAIAEVVQEGQFELPDDTVGPCAAFVELGPDGVSFEARASDGSTLSVQQLPEPVLRPVMGEYMQTCVEMGKLGVSADSARNRAFERALRKHIRPGYSVLDIGSGTGIWAIMAAKLGAARVVAVEREKLLAPIIDRLARNNGVQDIVEIVNQDSRKAK